MVDIRGLIALLSYKSGLAMPIAIMVVLAPIYEEWIFRGLMLRKLGILISSILFAVWHLKNLFYFEISIWAGLILGPSLGYVAVKTKSIWPGVVLHYLNNIGSLILMMTVLDWRSLF